MYKYLLVLSVCVCFFKQNVQADSIPTISNKDSFSFNVKIKAIDLSEDGIAGSTYNDEVFFFIYKQNGNFLPQLITAEFFRLDTTVRTKQLNIKTDAILETDTLTFILIEQDTKKQIKGIEPVCKFYLNEIFVNYQKNGITKFQEYFDDDDVIGMYRVAGDKFNLHKPIIKKFESLNFFDWAVYKLEISK